MSSFNIDVVDVPDYIWDNYIKYLDLRWEIVTREVTYLVYIGNFTRDDVLKMPVYERKYHYHSISDAREKEVKDMEDKLNKK